MNIGTRFSGQPMYGAANRFAPQKIFHSGCGEVEW